MKNKLLNAFQSSHMRILKLLIIGITLLVTKPLSAQVSVQVNIGSPPQWGPEGYSDERYYYLPDVEAYYDIQKSSFIYYEGSAWIYRTYLPVRYKNYDLYKGYKVVIVDYHGNSPYKNFKGHKTKYAKGYHGKPQKNIGGPGKNSTQKAATKNSFKKQGKGSPGGNGKKGKGGPGHGGGHGKK